MAPADLPMVLAHLHSAMSLGAALRLQLLATSWTAGAVTDVVVGGGFGLPSVQWPAEEPDVVRATARRARSLPDTVGAGMALLLCGLNPSVYAADRGVGYARPGNRFWPAAMAAGLVSRSHDPHHALAAHGVGMTDLVKRETVRADELDAEEYAAGAARVERLVRWLRPGAVCFVGLAGWRAVVDRRAVPGWQPSPFGGRPAYVMPSTSGLNARTGIGDLAHHLASAAAGPPGAPPR